MNRVTKNLVLRANRIDPGTGISPTRKDGRGECHPPRKSRADRLDLRIMLLYSARKNRANPLAEYSTL